MPDHNHPKTLTQMDTRLLKLKDFLVKAVSTEMQDHANEYKQDQQAVHRLLLEAYERTKTDIFRFDQTGISPYGKIIGQIRSTGMRPLFSPRLEASGFKLGGEIFGAGF
jgi:hypothetical protein